MNFEYIKQNYRVPAEMHREVIVNGKKGVITEDMGNYIGVNFYDNLTTAALPCHPTWEVTYLDSFNSKPPVKKQTRSQRRYQLWRQSDCSESFWEWIKYGMYKHYEKSL